MLNSTTALHDMVDDKCKKQEITFLPAGKEVFFASDVAGKGKDFNKMCQISHQIDNYEILDLS